MKELFNLVLQIQWNNWIDKTCGCRPFFYCKDLYEEEMNNPLKKKMEKQTNKKRLNVLESVNSIFFVMKDPFKKSVVNKKQFVENIGFSNYQEPFTYAICRKCLV
jgi:hypothetical protein